MVEKSNRIFKIGFILGFILIFIYLIVSLNVFNKDSLLDMLMSGKEEARFGIFFTVFITILMVFFVPISWFSALAGFFFGLKGFIYVIIGGVISSILSFYISRIFKKDVLPIISSIYNKKERKISLDLISKQIENHGIGYVFFMRSIPFIPFSIANYISGISSIPLKDYFLGTLLGLAPGQFITTYFFAKAVNIVEDPIEPLMAALVKGVYVVLIIIWRRKSKYRIKD